MRDELDLARGWFTKGDSDRAAAIQVLAGAGPYDTACFHLQQAVEKYLKSLIACAGQPIPKTHDLEVILGFCRKIHPALALDPAELASLTPFAVQLRYEMDFWPDRPTVEKSLSIVDRIRETILGLLPERARPGPAPP